METKNEILKKLNKLKPTLLSEYSVKAIGIFGSFSDNTFNEDSDIDILVEIEKPIGWKFFSLELYLEQILNRRVDLVTKNALKEQLKDGILKQVHFI